ncbi:Flagellar hook protein FlgE [Lentibacillus sp. JNUCC-1]|uniref:flagellar basal body rod protein FlgG n=1 Tax=Lentibacillus sp. JNUCC-1 TaxID=2654513 RepID=UPI0012E9647A|nr:flagellar basal body rod protein FlgG [Lentibacillus sp. JNUCC-1]MUV39957.1 Flagellar hook protein FlgE [Lentibacillus sp. JNUCC-1]
MLRSMYSGISGMKGFQTKLDVIGNNIANVNTVGFKKGRVTFQDLLSQTTSGASGPADGGTRGGINPKQVGLGSKLGSIDNLHTQGFSQTTNNPLDLQLEGDGMFVLDTGNGTAYTRAGNFYLDEGGKLVNADGFYVLDVNNGQITIPNDAKSISIEKDGTVTIVDATNQPQSLGQIGLAMFSNPSGLEKAGSNLYFNSENAGLADGLIAPESNGAASIVSGALEMSNVDLAEEFTEMITAQRGFQANTRIITTSDEILQELVNLKR